MNRLTDNDKNWGPFTLARYKNRFEIRLSSGDDEDPENYVMAVAFGWAIRCRLPKILKAAGEYGEHEREFSVSITKQGDNGYDFISIHHGPQTHDSSTTKAWFKSFPWKMWNHVRRSIYNPDGSHFATEEKGKWNEFYEIQKTCPQAHFGFEDYDGEMIVASCRIEEREWHRGEKWFSWLRFFYPKKIRRSLDIEFSEEVGTEKGSWKGGTIGTGIEMQEGETPEAAFRRFCDREHRAKHRNYRIKFIGPCGPPPPRQLCALPDDCGTAEAK